MELEADGIFRVDFGTILVTPAHIMHSVAHQYNMEPTQRPVMLIGEAATETRSGMVVAGSAPETVSVTTALALVTRGEVARILGNVYLTLTENPYPTKLFNEEDSARQWLRTFL